MKRHHGLLTTLTFTCSRLQAIGGQLAGNMEAAAGVAQTPRRDARLAAGVHAKRQDLWFSGPASILFRGIAMRALAVIVLVSGSVLVSPMNGKAATRKTAPPLEPPMQFHVVRSAHAGCEPNCLQWIAAQ